MSSSSALRKARSRLLVGSTFGGFFGYGTYKAKYDPPHLVWDLDNTILCSVTPLPPPTPSTSTIDKYLDSFDQIDDDFPFDKDVNNTRTYWRPFAHTMLKFCSLFAVQHIYTTAQGTYTDNILNALDNDDSSICRTMFHTIIHRDVAPSSVKKGKDLSLIGKAVILEQQTNQELEEGYDGERNKETSSSKLTASLVNRRMVLFDDRVKNFTPQNGMNGIHVWPFQINDIEEMNEPIFNLHQYVQEICEVSRMVGISVLCLLAPDVRPVVSYFRSKDHAEKFPAS